MALNWKPFVSTSLSLRVVCSSYHWAGRHDDLLSDGGLMFNQIISGQAYSACFYTWLSLPLKCGGVLVHWKSNSYHKLHRYCFSSALELIIVAIPLFYIFCYCDTLLRYVLKIFCLHIFKSEESIREWKRSWRSKIKDIDENYFTRFVTFSRVT